MLETNVVLIASSIGVILSFLGLVDVWQTRSLVKEEDPSPPMIELTRHHFISESLRLGVQLLFLVIALLLKFGNERLEEIAILILVTIPVILAAWSIYGYLRRRSQRRLAD